MVTIELSAQDLSAEERLKLLSAPADYSGAPSAVDEKPNCWRKDDNTIKIASNVKIFNKKITRIQFFLEIPKKSF